MHLCPIDGEGPACQQSGQGVQLSRRDWAQVIVGIDADPTGTRAIATWCRDCFDALHPFSAGGAYVDFMMDEGQERVQASFRDNYARLTRVKRQYDPDNMFRINQNIRPA
jgi:hypothetical protein